MSETHDPWKAVGLELLKLKDTRTIEALLRVINEAQAAEATQHQQEIAAKDETIDGLRLVALGWEKQRDEARARLAAVEAERDMLNGALEAAPDAGILSRTIDKLAAERDRLKAALEEISGELPCERPCKPCQPDCETCGVHRGGYWCAGCVARAALSGEGTAKP